MLVTVIPSHQSGHASGLVDGFFMGADKKHQDLPAAVSNRAPT
jgi:hypothetical protein